MGGSRSRARWRSRAHGRARRREERTRWVEREMPIGVLWDILSSGSAEVGSLCDPRHRATSACKEDEVLATSAVRKMRYYFFRSKEDEDWATSAIRA
ncbi:hypothetical protein Nepgr_019938 [Nepenthes gracilis]|uniref:Uncharacterized protein n=1 Tax=Nepenthes gracilis TaxID=150966 RepID=A0AAD3SW61_NEPGR|nr:hypothetical protein Nepgr_019938 [Nepenthes gracilis]